MHHLREKDFIVRPMKPLKPPFSFLLDSKRLEKFTDETTTTVMLNALKKCHSQDTKR